MMNIHISSPAPDGTLDLTVRAESPGAVGDMHGQLQPGQKWDDIPYELFLQHAGTMVTYDQLREEIL
jgi:hypothetical protein